MQLCSTTEHGTHLLGLFPHASENLVPEREGSEKEARSSELCLSGGGQSGNRRRLLATTISISQQTRVSDLCLLALRFVMCGARCLQKQNRAAWFLFFVGLLLPIVVSQGDRELAHVREDSHSSSIDGGNHVEEQQQLNSLGSRPPCCERKCGDCAPCKPVQVRAGAAEGRLRPQCANYEPVGWKCKCGAAVFDP